MIPARAGAGRSIRIAVCGRGRGEEWIGSWERFLFIIKQENKIVSCQENIFAL